MEIPNISINNGSPDWGLHRFSDGVVFHCAKNTHGFWTAIGPAKELTKPIKLVLGKLEIEDCACKFWAQDRMIDKLELVMPSTHPPPIIDGCEPASRAGSGQNTLNRGGGAASDWKKGGLVKKTTKAVKPTKTVKKSVKKTAKKSKKSKKS